MHMIVSLTWQFVMMITKHDRPTKEHPGKANHDRAANSLEENKQICQIFVNTSSPLIHLS